MRRIRLATDADVPQLRRLVNGAYRALGDMGLNFTGVDQDEEVTRTRMRGREVYVVEQDGALIGTVSFTVKRRDGDEPYGYVNLLAVEPSHQRHGLGASLMQLTEDRARELGMRAVRLDTAIPATHLMRWYEARGYGKVAEVQWPGKTYRSVILEKRLS